MIGTTNMNFVEHANSVNDGKGEGLTQTKSGFCTLMMEIGCPVNGREFFLDKYYWLI